jgi:uncharacterized protein
MKNPYIPRLLDPLIAELFGDLPALLIVGPRATGKTTSARRLAKDTLRLDKPADEELVRNDPDTALSSFSTPLLIDEWQVVPSILGAVKRAVDDETGAGRYLLTGSTQSDLTVDGWPATGRVTRLTMYGLVEREIVRNSHRRSLFDIAYDGDLAQLAAPAERPDLRGYVQLALRSGFPEAALLSSERTRDRWLASYIDEVVTRDLKISNSEIRDPVRLRRYLQACAANTAGVVEHKTLFDTAQISRATAVSYDALLQHLMVIDRLPAWSSNHATRLIRSPKYHLVEPALMGPLLGVDARSVLRDSNLLGRLIESYVLSQLRVEAAVADKPVTLYHLRNKDGTHEVDILAERADGAVVAIEVKATSAPTIADAKHLLWLKDRLGEKFVQGIVFHSGPLPFHHPTGISFMPISTLWGSQIPLAKSRSSKATQHLQPTQVNP